MNLPPQPDERPANPAGAAWTWRLEDADGREVEVPAEHGPPTFTSQADAESWIGEAFADLLDVGVDAATLVEGDRVVYGPMSLHP